MPQLQLKEEDIVCLILEYLQKRDLGEFTFGAINLGRRLKLSDLSDEAIFLQALVNSR